MKQIGFFWHYDKDNLIEWCHSYDAHMAYIMECTPYKGRELWIDLFKPVQGILPYDMVDVDKIADEGLSGWEYHSKVYEVSRRAIQANLQAIMALHAIECPNCPWDGE